MFLYMLTYVPSLQYYLQLHHHHHHHLISFMELGHLLARSVLTQPEVSSNVYYIATTQLPHSYHIATTQPLHSYYIATTQLLHSHYIATTQLPQSYHVATTQLQHQTRNIVRGLKFSQWSSRWFPPCVIWRRVTGSKCLINSVRTFTAFKMRALQVASKCRDPTAQ